jgi:hypothetical protein
MVKPGLDVGNKVENRFFDCHSDETEETEIANPVLYTGVKSF